MYLKFQWLKLIIKWDIAGQKFQEKNYFFKFSVKFQKYCFTHLYVTYVIR